MPRSIVRARPRSGSIAEILVRKTSVPSGRYTRRHIGRETQAADRGPATASGCAAATRCCAPDAARADRYPRHVCSARCCVRTLTSRGLYLHRRPEQRTSTPVREVCRRAAAFVQRHRGSEPVRISQAVCRRARQGHHRVRRSLVRRRSHRRPLPGWFEPVACRRSRDRRVARNADSRSRTV